MTDHQPPNRRPARPAPILSGFKFNAAHLSDCGRQRKANEDAEVFLPESGFFAVIDGMGGLTAGAMAAKIIAEVMPEVLNSAAAGMGTNISPELAGNLLADGVQQVSDNMQATGNPDGLPTFGATFVGVWLIADQAVFVNLGDSRAYVLSSLGKLRQVSRDHSIVALLVEQGEITPEQAKTHPARSTITRFVGMPSPAKPDLFIETIHSGERLLLCSDGLNGMIPNNRIAAIMDGGGDPENICEMLVEAANEAGGEDNITVAVIEIGVDRNLITAVMQASDLQP